MQAMRHPQHGKSDVPEADIAKYSLTNFHSQLDCHVVLHDKNTFLQKWHNLKQ